MAVRNCTSLSMEYKNAFAQPREQLYAQLVLLGYAYLYTHLVVAGDIILHQQCLLFAGVVEFITMSSAVVTSAVPVELLH